ncbi:RNA polymerase sigma factor [Hwanghaeella sp.]|uniref:RNA polymerase sigma factor n=1 Tax=Hwanghaeella sp. TaxID=2605943 RepID=UPI003CCBBB20
MKMEPAARAPADMLNDETDLDLAKRIIEGDTHAFELLMRRCNQRLYRIAISVVRDRSEAEDVVQETYVKAYAKMSSFHGPNSILAWLSRIAMNEALGRLRKHRATVSLETDGSLPLDQNTAFSRGDQSLPPDTITPETLASSAELRQRLEDAVLDLPSDFRTVFILREIDGLSTEDTAYTLSIPEATVKTRLHRARRLMQEHLGSAVDPLLPVAFQIAGARCDRIVASVLQRLERVKPHNQQQRRIGQHN